MEQTGPSTGPVNRPAPVTLDQALGAKPAIALSGGGTKGDFEVGAVRYLYDNGVHPKILSGTSVGSINALKLAEGEGAPTGAPGHVRGLAGLEQIWHSLKNDADMWQPDPTIADLANKFKTLPDEVNQVMADGDAVKVTAGLSFAFLFPGSPATIAHAAALAKLASDAGTLISDAQGAIADLQSAVSLANLNPIHGRMQKPAAFQPGAQKTSGIALRLAMVALEDGQLRYVTETGAVIERDGSPTLLAPVADPKCADPIHKQLDPILQQLADVADQIDQAKTLGPNGKPMGSATKVAQLEQQQKDLQAKAAPLKTALANCPRVNGPQLTVDPVVGALASSSIPVIFPPVAIGVAGAPAPGAQQHYVDAGIRMLVPVEAAVNAGASMVFAVAASNPKLEVASMGGPLPTIFAIAARVGAEIEPDEVGRKDLFPMNGWGVPVMVIQPEQDVHDSMTIEPGLVNIRMAHGYMRADDTVQAYLGQMNEAQSPMAQLMNAKPDPYAYLRLANRYSKERKTFGAPNAPGITDLRFQIWQLEFGANGKKFVPGQPLPPAPSGFANAPVDVNAMAQVRQLKQQLKTLVTQRIKAGGKMPPGYEQWWRDWEAHAWSPTQPFLRLTASIHPASMPLNVQTTFRVDAKDEESGDPVIADVLVDGAKVGVTGQDTKFTFKAIVEQEPKMPKITDVPEISVRKAGYQGSDVKVTFQKAATP